MSSPAFQLQKAYFTALNGNVSYNSSVVPVYDEVPDGATYPYIELGNYTELDDSTKSDFGFECTFSVNIVDRFPKNTGGNASIYSINDTMRRLIRNRPLPLSMDDYRVITSVADNVINDKETTDTYTYRVLRVRFRHLLRYAGWILANGVFEVAGSWKDNANWNDS